MGTYACTGSASGIGAALIEILRSQGHDVISVDIVNADIIADLSSPKGRQIAIEGIQQIAPTGLDGLVPAAGLGRGLATSQLITSVNYFGTVELVQGLRSALRRRRGSVVLLGSNSASLPKDRPKYMEALLAGDEARALKEAKALQDAVCYMLGKRALTVWMRGNVMTYAREGIRLNMVAPGLIATPMSESLLGNTEFSKMNREMLDATPVKRIGRPDEVAELIHFLLASKADYICGSVVYIDGGFDAHSRQNLV